MLKLGMSSLKDKPLKKCHTDNRKMIDDIHGEIIQNLTDSEIVEYYLDNGVILDEYYSKKENNKKRDTFNQGGILNFFNSENKDNDEKEFKHVKETTNDVINKYMCNINDNILTSKFSADQNDKCKICNSQMRLSEITSELTCIKCGYQSEIIIITEKNSYSEPPREINYFSYKRINHFNEWLAQFQAKEKTELPENIYQNIINEIKKDYNYNLENLKYKDIRNILKKLNYNKYYEHIPHIISVISDKPAPVLDRKTEEILRTLFKEIQIPFMNNCPPGRKNFLSYSYVLHKFCELLEFDNLLEYFPLLKSREKLHAQDLIWEKICKDLKWQFIPSL